MGVLPSSNQPVHPKKSKKDDTTLSSSLSSPLVSELHWHLIRSLGFEQSTPASEVHDILVGSFLENVGTKERVIYIPTTKGIMSSSQAYIPFKGK